MSKEPKEYLKLGGAILLMVVSIVYLANSISLYLRSSYQLATIGDLSTGLIYYVDAQAGSDSNSGRSIDQPWRTVAKVNATAFVAGDQILFRRGGVWAETLIPKSSGSASQPITFGAYGDGQLPEFNGGGILVNTLRLENKDNLTFTDLVFTNNKVNTEGSIFMLYGQNIKLQNLVVKNNGGPGITGLMTSNLIINNSDVIDNNHQGVYLAYATNSLIERNRVHGNSRGKDDSFGIDMIVPAGGNIVRYNEVHDQTLITDPSLFKYGNGGIRFDGDNGSNQRNTDMAGNQAYRNLVYNEDQGIQLINFSSAEVYNNSVYNTRQYGIVASAQPGFGINSKNKIQNNIIRASSSSVILANLNGPSNLIDYNVYYPTTGNNFVWTSDPNWDSNTLGRISFSDWKSISGLDSHSLVGNPRFISAPSNFDLQASSPAINVGTILEAGADFLNRAIVGIMDIGAYEYQGVPSACVEDWSCGDWGTCVNGSQTKTCTDINDCGTTTTKPATTQTCTSCSPTTWYRDADQDTYGNSKVTISACAQPAGYVANKNDCNDNISATQYCANCLPKKSNSNCYK